MDGDQVVVEESWSRDDGTDDVRQTLTLPLVLGGTTTAMLTVSRGRDRRFSREDAMTRADWSFRRSRCSPWSRGSDRRSRTAAID